MSRSKFKIKKFQTSKKNCSCYNLCLSNTSDADNIASDLNKSNINLIYKVISKSHFAILFFSLFISRCLLDVSGKNFLNIKMRKKHVLVGFKKIYAHMSPRYLLVGFWYIALVHSTYVLRIHIVINNKFGTGSRKEGVPFRYSLFLVVLPRFLGRKKYFAVFVRDLRQESV